MFDVRVFVDVFDASGVERRRAPLDAVDCVTLVEQQAREIGAILPGNTRNQCNFAQNMTLGL